MAGKQVWNIALFALLVNSYTYGQIVSDRTNNIVLSFDKATIISELPEIKWEQPRLEFTNTQENRINVQASVVSSVPLKNVSISIKESRDGEPLGTKTADMEEGDYTVKVNQDLNLADGENIIELTAETEKGGIVKDFRSIRVGMDAIADAVLLNRKDYALLVATDKYDNWNDLVNPVFDARAIGEELEKRYGFEVEILEDPDQDEVMTKLRDYAQINYEPQDQLFIFFAGHGMYDEVFGEGFLVARNSAKNDPSKNTYISHNRIRSNINNIQCEHIFLSMDVCFGGTFDPVLASARNIYEETDQQAYLVKKLSKKTRKFLTSGSKEYVSDGIRGEHSPFARNMLEALKSNGGEDRILILDEIKLYMEKMRTTPRFGEFGSDEDGSDFVFVAQ